MNTQAPEHTQTCNHHAHACPWAANICTLCKKAGLEKVGQFGALVVAAVPGQWRGVQQGGGQDQDGHGHPLHPGRPLGPGNLHQGQEHRGEWDSVSQL